MASATSSITTTKSSVTSGMSIDSATIDYVRAGCALHTTLGAIRPFAKQQLNTWHAKLLQQPAGIYNGEPVTLKDLPPCPKHARRNGTGHVAINKLAACELCGPWVKALAAAHSSGQAKNLNARSMYPFKWRDKHTGPWSLATVFIRGSLAAADIDHADVTCLVNIIKHCTGAFSTLTADVQERLGRLVPKRNKIAHRSSMQLSGDERRECIAACIEVLEDGPWAEGSFKAATAKALEAVRAWRDRPMELLPRLDQLEPHYVPQNDTLLQLSRVASHRVVALCGLGGIGKSTIARAYAWQLVHSGACPGRYGVLWGSAASDEGGVAAALASIAQGQLGMHLSAEEAANDAVVRQLLTGWAAGRDEPWLLVLDNVEPGTKEMGLVTLLGDNGKALVTTRAGPNALYRDMGLPRAAVLRLQCLAPDDGYKLLMARYWSSQRTPSPLAAALPSTEEAAARELVGAKGVDGLPLALVQVAALVANTPGQTFVEYLKQFVELSPGGVTTQLPGDDGGRLDVAQALAALVTTCGLQDVEGLVDQLVAAKCESLDDVQWLEVEDVVWGAGAGAAPSAVQRRKWAAFKKRCKDAGVAARHEATVATVWATQLKVLPAYCVELLRGASCYAPEHIPQSLFEEALRRWVEVSKASEEEDWLASFAGSSALVDEVSTVSKRATSGGSVVEAVVEAALKWLADLSLVHRGAWTSAGDIHPQLGTGAFSVTATGHTTPSTQAAVPPATGGAGQGAGAGPHDTSSSPPARPWFNMHRLVQGVVFGSKASAATECGLMAMAALEPALTAGVDSIRSTLQGVSRGASMADMEVAAWLAAHGHAVQLARVVAAQIDAATATADVKKAVPQVVAAVEALSRLVSVLGLFRDGDGWCSALENTKQLMAALLGDCSAVAGSLNNLAQLYLAQSRYDEAEPLFVQSLAMEQRLAGDSNSSAVANALNNLAGLYRAQSRYDEAEALLVPTLAMRQRLHGGSDSSAVANALNNLAMLYYAQSRYDEAKPLLVQALAMWKRLHVDSDSSDVALSLNNLAALLMAQSRYDEAEPLLEQAIPLYERLLGDSDSSDMARAVNSLAELYNAQGRYAEAKPLYVKSLAMRKRLHGDSDSSAVANALNNLALLYKAQSRYDEAEPLYVQALAMEQRLHGGSDSSDVARALNNLAQLYKDQSRYDKAGPLLAQALAMCQRLHGGSDSSDVATALSNLAGLYKAQSRYDEAEPLLVQALAMFQRLAGDSDSKDVATCLRGMALLYTSCGKIIKAENFMVKAIAMLHRIHGAAEHPDLVDCLRNLALLQLAAAWVHHVGNALFASAAAAYKAKRHSEALHRHSQALDLRRLVDADPATIAASLHALAMVHKALHNLDAARPLLVEAIELRKDNSSGENSALLAQSLVALVNTWPSA